MTEPEYIYVKGKGWIPDTTNYVIRVHEGRRYKVSGEIRENGKIKKGERTFSDGASRGLEYALKNVKWFEEYFDTPAGFGGAYSADQTLTRPVVIIHTVPL